MAGQAHVRRMQAPGKRKELGRVLQAASSPLARLTDVMDEAWEAGRLTPEAIHEAIEQCSKGPTVWPVTDPRTTSQPGGGGCKTGWLRRSSRMPPKTYEISILAVRGAEGDGP